MDLSVLEDRFVALKLQLLNHFTKSIFSLGKKRYSTSHWVPKRIGRKSCRIYNYGFSKKAGGINKNATAKNFLISSFISVRMQSIVKNLVKNVCLALIIRIQG